MNQQQKSQTQAQFTFTLVETRHLLKAFQSIPPTTININHLSLYSRNDFIIMPSKTEIFCIVTLGAKLPSKIDVDNCFRYPLMHYLIKLIPDSIQQNAIALYRKTSGGCSIELVPLTNIIHRSHKGLIYHFEAELIDIERLDNENYIAMDSNYYLHVFSNWKYVMSYNSKATMFKVNYGLSAVITIDQSSNVGDYVSIYKDFKQECYKENLNMILRKRTGGLIVLIETFLWFLCIVYKDGTIAFCSIEESKVEGDSQDFQKKIGINNERIVMFDNCASEKGFNKGVFSIWNDKEKIMMLFNKQSNICQLFCFEYCDWNNKEGTYNKIELKGNICLCNDIIGAAINNINQGQVKFILLLLTEKGDLYQYNCMDELPSSSTSFHSNNRLNRRFSFNNISKSNYNYDLLINHSVDQELSSIDNLITSNHSTIKNIYNDILNKGLPFLSNDYKAIINQQKTSIQYNKYLIASLSNRLAAIGQSVNNDIQSYDLLSNNSITLLLPSPQLKDLYNSASESITNYTYDLYEKNTMIKDINEFGKELIALNPIAKRIMSKAQMYNKFNDTIAVNGKSKWANEVLVMYMRKLEEKKGKLDMVFQYDIMNKYLLVKKKFDEMKGDAPRDILKHNIDQKFEVRKEVCDIEEILRKVKVKKSKIKMLNCRELKDFVKEKEDEEIKERQFAEKIEEETRRVRKWIELEEKIMKIQEGLKEKEKGIMQEWIKEKEMELQEIEREKKEIELRLLKEKEEKIKREKEEEIVRQKEIERQKEKQKEKNQIKQEPQNQAQVKQSNSMDKYFPSANNNNNQIQQPPINFKDPILLNNKPQSNPTNNTYDNLHIISNNDDKNDQSFGSHPPNSLGRYDPNSIRKKSFMANFDSFSKDLFHQSISPIYHSSHYAIKSRHKKGNSNKNPTNVNK